MTPEEKIKKEIKERIENRPHFKVYCLLCKEYCVTISEKREMVHYDCWVAWKKSRSEPSDSTQT